MQSILKLPVDLLAYVLDCASAEAWPCAAATCRLCRDLLVTRRRGRLLQRLEAHIRTVQRREPHQSASAVSSIAQASSQLLKAEWPPAQGYVLLDQISTTLTMHLGHTVLDMKEPPLNVHEMINLASCCGRVARVLPIQMVDDLIETVRRSEVAWHAAVCLQRDVLAEGISAHDMGLPDSQSSEEFPISPQVPEDNSVFSRTTLHAALGGGDMATS